VVNEILKNYRKLSPASEQELRAIATDLYKSYEIFDITEKIILLASELREEYMFSYWDSLIVATALDAGATTVLTQDMQTGLVVRENLTIRNPYR
jgi:predicted nucleic acid-binding protein